MDGAAKGGAGAAPIASVGGAERPGRLRAALSNRRTHWFLELFAIWGLAFTQPILDLYGKAPDEFVVRRIGGVQLVVFAIATALIVPVVLWVIVSVVDVISRRAAEMIQRFAVALGLGVLIQQVAVGPLGIVPALLIGAGAATVTAVVLFNLDAFRSWLRLLALGPVVFVMLFLFSSSVSPLVTDTSSIAGKNSVAGAAASPSDIVWIMLDELPVASLLDGNGQIDANAFPNFALLASESRWFRNTSTVAPNTTTALPAMMTSRYPEGTPAPDYRSHPNNFFTVLQNSHELNVQESVTQLCPPDVCEPFATAEGGVAPLVRSAASGWFNRLRQSRNEGAKVELNTFTDAVKYAGLHDQIRIDSFATSLLAPRAQPRLDYAHLVVPHFPWEILPDGHTYTAPNGELMRGAIVFTWGTPYSADAAKLRHLLQLQYVDAQLGRMITNMKASGLWDNALIVVSADHGVSFRIEQPFRAVTTGNAWEVLWPPLFIRGADFSAGIDDRPVSVMDIFPTIADVQGIAVPWEMQGRSLRQPPPAVPDTQRLVRTNILNQLPASDLADYGVADIPSNFETVLRAPRWSSGTDALKMFRHGDPYGIVGARADALPEGPPAEVTVKLQSGEPTFNLDATSAELPAYFEGDATPQYATGNLAVVFNGTIVGVIPLDAAGVFGMLPEALFVAGTNTFSLHLIEGEGDALIRRPVAITT